MKLPFLIAVRFLKSNKGQTILIALGIAVGVSVQIFIGLLIQGLQKGLIDKTVGNSPQITVTSRSEDKAISDYREIQNKLKSADGRIVNISFSADGPALVKGESQSYSVLVRGMKIDSSDKIYNISSRIYEGRSPESDFEVIIGKDLRQELAVNIGDTLEIITNSGEIQNLNITGFFDLKVAALNSTWIITSLETSQAIFLLGDRITAVEMQVKDIFKADDIAFSIADNLGDGFKVDNWKAQNEELLSGLSGQSVSSTIIQVFVLVAVVLGISSVLAITVLQKSKQIGILKAMGIKDKTASLIFLFQGGLLGVIGAVLGIGFGLLLILMFTTFAVNSDGTSIINLYIDYGFIGGSALVAVASAAAASLIPARNSSKLNPIEVIRNG